MNRTFFFTFLLIICLALPGFAQRRGAGGGGGQRLERVHAIKVGFITDRIHLSAQQSEKFWPVYNAYEDDLRAARRDFRKKYREGAADSDDSRQFIEDNLDFQEQVLALKRKYKDQFLQVISAKQLADLYVAERDFRKLLMQQLRNRGGRR